MSKRDTKSARPITAVMASQMKLLRQHGLYQHQIAALFQINQGRVSEIITGKRFPDAPVATQLSLPF